MSVKALLEKKAPLVKAIRALSDKINAENRDFTAEEQEQWKKVNADYNLLVRQIEAAERADSLETDLAKRREMGSKVKDASKLVAVGGDGLTADVLDRYRTLAFGAWCRSQYEVDLDEDQAEACQALGFNPRRRELALSLYNTHDYNRLQSKFRSVHPNLAGQVCSDFRADLSIGSGPAGGYLVAPEQLVRSLEINMLAFGGMRQVAEAMRTTSGERITWPGVDDTSNAGVQLGESTSIGSSVDPTFKRVYWDAYKFSSKAILVPFELLQDSVFNLPAIIGQLQGERLGRITNTKFTTGTGAATPFGLIAKLVARSFTSAAASATAISGDDLLGLVHSVDPAYRIGGGFMLHDAILLALRKLKDGNGMYLWQSGLREGVPDRLLGYPLTNNQDMDSTMASGKYTIAFGRLSNYKIRTVGDIRMYRLEERYRDTDQDGFIAFTREDGNLLDAGTAPVKVLSH